MIMGLKRSAAAPIEGEAIPEVAATEAAAPATTEAPVAEAGQQFDAAAVPDSPLATTASAGSALANSAGIQSVAVRQPKEDDNFDGLDQDLGFGSFPIVRLDKGEFLVGDDTTAYTGFFCRMVQSKRKFLYKANGKEDCETFVYSYDEDPATGRDAGGRPLVEHFLEWRAAGEMDAGAQPVCIMYREMVAEVFGNGLGPKINGQMVILSIPPASRNRLGGVNKTLQMRSKRLDQVVIEVTRGDKISKDPKKTFYPWNFRIAGAYVPPEEAALEAFKLPG